MRPNYFDFDQQQSRRVAAVAMARPVAWHLRASEPVPAPPTTGALYRAATALLRTLCRRARERRQLARLDARLLRDIGVTPCEAEREINKPIWRR